MSAWELNGECLYLAEQVCRCLTVYVCKRGPDVAKQLLAAVCRLRSLMENLYLHELLKDGNGSAFRVDMYARVPLRLPLAPMCSDAFPAMSDAFAQVFPLQEEGKGAMHLDAEAWHAAAACVHVALQHCQAITAMKPAGNAWVARIERQSEVVYRQCLLLT